jgi:hypothetical protein
VLFKNNSDRITQALRSIPITETSSLLWLCPTLPDASPTYGKIELQYELQVVLTNSPPILAGVPAKYISTSTGKASHVSYKSLCKAPAALMPVVLQPLNS